MHVDTNISVSYYGKHAWFIQYYACTRKAHDCIGSFLVICTAKGLFISDLHKSELFTYSKETWEVGLDTLHQDLSLLYFLYGT